MENQHESMKCGCPCHESGGTCSTCSSTECGGGKGSFDPVNISAMVGQKAFFKAHMELMAEKMKKKIDAAWGKTIDKEVDAILEKMDSQWMAMVQQAKAEQIFREKLMQIYSGAENKKI